MAGLHDTAGAHDGDVRSRRRLLLKGAGGLFLGVLVGLLAWLALEARVVKENLEQARSEAVQTKEALSNGKVEAAAQHAGAVQAHARKADDAAHSIPWKLAGKLPWIGSPFVTGQQISNVVLGFANDVLEPSAHVGLALSPDRLFDGSRLDVQLLRSEEPTIRKLAADAGRLDAEASAIATPAYLSEVADARSKLQAQISSISRVLQTTALAARLAPSMMGADGPTTYFMGFQTNAEARGTGGIIGGFGILHFDNGSPTVETLGANTALEGPFRAFDLGVEYAAQYGYTNPTTDIRNSNLSSNFPYAAQIWKSMWAQESGVNVDGVIAIDPVALSYILGAIGPVRLSDGEEVSKDNVVRLTESTAYDRFPTDQVARKKYLQDIAAEVVKKMTRSVQSPRELLAALGKAIGERRIAAWSASEANQKLLAATPLAHEIPDDSAPYAELVLNNLAGNKMDYYLKRQITYTGDRCGQGMRNTTVTMKLTSDAPTVPLPEYVAGALGLSRDVPIKMPSGSMMTSVRLIATKGAVLQSAFANNQQIPVFSGVERGHPTFEVQVVIPPRLSGELIFHLSEPASPGAPRVPVQPLADPVTPDIRVPECN
ncbi:DUF4012 domain-containing protein [Mycolicibacterium mucogenicum]|uniref:DUF4012 domain-containing protein n=1 Tax=Mycolicibacterium mucogenicum DSM 44124 TaxID=1226753 RepID=A0A8H2J962_MYCMU|nr:DUF4012 domain-containing protein [Mycolicibacterium mucogenicum]KAB7751642.1 membrane protein [Mycolicibacterium mucogenicum DSM 44124]QPG69708.1 DUF4012 domain-containing protein [Mycolicibacterium mucogenicum DSM 44124]